MSLISLPYDVLFNVVKLLDVEEQVNLGKTCPLFKYICGEPSLCRIAAQVSETFRSALLSFPGV
jgi:F-box domain